ncbi:MAG TPA: CNNM domain-containing protein [Chloroflexota bacterium]|nr:CNNM domain-containing protein [Chloroflexota bacterium]
MRIGDYDGHLALGWLGEPAFAHLVEPPLEALIGNFAPTASHGIAVGISFAIITTLHIVIGELAPTGLALQTPEGTSLWVARPLQVFEVTSAGRSPCSTAPATVCSSCLACTRRRGTR